MSLKATLVLGLAVLLSSCSNADSQTKLPSSANDSAPMKADTVLFSAAPGQIKINGTLESDNFEGQYIRLFETEGKEQFLVDSAQIVQGKFSFVQSNIIPGIFKIGLSENFNKLGEIVLNPVEKEISLVYKNDNFAYGLIETSSIENKALKAYTLAFRAYDSEVRTIRKGRLEKKAKKASLYRADENFKKVQDAMASQYPGTFLANMVAHLQSPYRFDKNAYWDDIDFNDRSLIHSLVYPNRIEDYMRIHASKGGNSQDPTLGFYNAVDQIAAKIKENGDDDVLSFVLYTMSEGFYSSGLEDVSLYVLDNYFYGDGCGDADINALFKMRASGIRNLQIGNTPQDFTLNTPEGKAKRLSDIAKQNQYTVVLFWASFCHKCEMEIPSLIPIYNQYKADELELVAVSVDSDKTDWVDAINQSKSPWINVSDLAGWKSQVAKDYRITSTPVYFVVDRKMKIVSRPQNSRALATFLSNNIQ